MSWTRVEIEVDVDGDKERAIETAGDLSEALIDDDRVIVVSAHVMETHRDDCDGYPCTCKDAA